MIHIFSKESINFYLSIFIILIISLLCCVSLYYIIPNNYIIHYNQLINKIKPFKIIKIKINKYDKYIINNNLYNLNNMIIQFKTKNYPIKILICNFLKSQNLYIFEDTLLQPINNSYISIINDNNKNISLDLNLYLKEEVL
jgi:hypothetical protein